MKLIQNEARCLKCNDIIVSKTSHDFVTCKCGSISVDGGMNYTRRVGDFENFEDRSMYMNENDLNECIDVLRKSKENKNELGQLLSIIRTLRDRGYLNMEKFDCIPLT